MKVGVIGAGAMGSGIAQIASQAGHKVVVSDARQEALDLSKSKLSKIMARQVEKRRITEGESIKVQDNITYCEGLEGFSECGIVIEAIVEDLTIKKALFSELEDVVGENCILATNTSSLSIASIASACRHSGRVLGVHFFNPAPLMPLVEIIPAIQTNAEITEAVKGLISSWKKSPVVAKDSPGFIVNRIARPFYGEALRIYDEGMVPHGREGFATIDSAMKELGGFRMGPFELMDFIGNDINYAVTESTFKAFYYDPRYKPSLTQKNYTEAGWLGRKSGRGFYDYSEGSNAIEVSTLSTVKAYIVKRILIMLINEAADAVYLNIASIADIDLAMKKGVNYPKGLLEWADEFGISECVKAMDDLQEEYREDRYRCSPLLRRMTKNGATFYD